MIMVVAVLASDGIDTLLGLCSDCGGDVGVR